MAYELIDQELNLWSCGITDLTMKQVECFLKQWEDDSRVGSLTVFFDPKENTIVLNRDHKNYDSNLKICTVYLALNKDERKQLVSKVKSDTAHDIIDILDMAIQSKENQHTMYLLSNQPLIPDEFNASWDVFKMIKQKYSHGRPSVWMFKAFEYGVMQGKRIERARRKRERSKEAIC